MSGHRCKAIPERFPVAARAAVLAALLTVLLILPTMSTAAPACGEWDLVSSPNVGNYITRLTAVTSLSANDAWSVGYWRNEPAGSGPLLTRWNGSQWNVGALPTTDHLGTQPVTVGVDAAPNGDVWVVGYVSTPYPTHNLPLVLRWRDGDWEVVETVTLRPQTEYPFGPRGGFAYAVDAVTADDIWAVGVGAGYGDASSSTVPLAIHWDGSTWTDIEVPLVANRHHELDAVVAIASDDVWAVGDYRNISGVYRGVTYHWDGTAWSHVWSPIEDMIQGGLEAVAATGPNDVWALGGANGAPVLMHWSGSAWSLVPAPPNSGGSLAVVAPDDLWVSGWNGFWHWDGSAWTEVPAQVPGATYVIRGGDMEIVGDCDIWCVGFWTLADGLTSFTLAERLQPATAAVSAAPGASLSLLFRNPFTPGGQIRVGVPSGGAATLALHDLNGRKVRTLFESSSGRVNASLTWDGRGYAGTPLPGGVYYMTLDAGTSRTTKKLVLLGGIR